MGDNADTLKDSSVSIVSYDITIRNGSKNNTQLLIKHLDSSTIGDSTRFYILMYYSINFSPNYYVDVTVNLITDNGIKFSIDTSPKYSVKENKVDILGIEGDLKAQITDYNSKSNKTAIAIFDAYYSSNPSGGINNDVTTTDFTQAIYINGNKNIQLTNLDFTINNGNNPVDFYMNGLNFKGRENMDAISVNGDGDLNIYVQNDSVVTGGDGSDGKDAGNSTSGDGATGGKGNDGKNAINAVPNINLLGFFKLDAIGGKGGDGGKGGNASSRPDLPQLTVDGDGASGLKGYDGGNGGKGGTGASAIVTTKTLTITNTLINVTSGNSGNGGTGGRGGDGQNGQDGYDKAGYYSAHEGGDGGKGGIGGVGGNAGSVEIAIRYFDISGSLNNTSLGTQGNGGDGGSGGNGGIGGIGGWYNSGSGGGYGKSGDNGIGGAGGEGGIGLTKGTDGKDGIAF